MAFLLRYRYSQVFETKEMLHAKYSYNIQTLNSLVRFVDVDCAISQCQQPSILRNIS